MSTKSMDVFSLRDSVVGEYRKFATSFTTIHATESRRQVEAIYAEGRFWPEPLIQINPSHKAGATFASLTAGGALHPRIPEILQFQGNPLRLHKPQEQAIALTVLHVEPWAELLDEGFADASAENLVQCPVQRVAGALGDLRRGEEQLDKFLPTPSEGPIVAQSITSDRLPE